MMDISVLPVFADVGEGLNTSVLALNFATTLSVDCTIFGFVGF